MGGHAKSAKCPRLRKRYQHLANVSQEYSTSLGKVVDIVVSHQGLPIKVNLVTQLMSALVLPAPEHYRPLLRRFAALGTPPPPPVHRLCLSAWKSCRLLFALSPLTVSVIRLPASTWCSHRSPSPPPLPDNFSTPCLHSPCLACPCQLVKSGRCTDI